MAHALKLRLLLEIFQKKLHEGIDRSRILNGKELENNLLQVSRAIDHAVASKQVPSSPQKVLEVFKLIARLKDDDFMKPSMMVFVVAVKGACGAGWFKASEAEELLSLYDQLLIYFHLDGNCSRPVDPSHGEQSAVVNLLTTVCERYCPRIKLVSVVLSLETKKEYESRGCDFNVAHLAANTKLSLFVIHTELTQTSACLVTPNKLSFILNGKGVDRRTYSQTSTMEPGPQLPTEVTHMLRLGNNFMQVVGESSGKYLVAIAATSVVPFTSASASLAEYIAPPTEGNIIDDEVVEAGSRISLCCPISHKRIITPVKGFGCKHHQCFEFENYIEMNLARPIWRCPCCNASVNCLDIRLDRKMQEILKEADNKYNEAIINPDGSWALNVLTDQQKESNFGFGTTAIDSENVNYVGARLENGVIDLTEDEDIRETAPPIFPFNGQSVVTSNTLEPPDKKPDIRVLSGAMSTTDPVNPFPNNESTANVSSQTGSSTCAGVAPDVNGGQRLNHNATTHLWSGGNTSFGVPVTTNQALNRAASLDTFNSAFVNQSNPVENPATQRVRAGPQVLGVSSGPVANVNFVSNIGQQRSYYLSPIQSGSEQVLQHDVLQQQSLDLLRQNQINATSYLVTAEQGASQRSWLGGQNALGANQPVLASVEYTTGVQMQPFGNSIQVPAEHFQTYAQAGFNALQEAWVRQRSPPLQQAVLTNTNPRVTVGRSPPISSVGAIPNVSTSGQNMSSPRTNFSTVRTADGTTAGHVSTSRTTTEFPPQVNTWRPAGRMRGSVSGGYVPSGWGGGSSQPGMVTGMRTTSGPNAAASNLTSRVQTNANSVPSNQAATGSDAGHMTTYEADRGASDRMTVPNDFILSSPGARTPGETVQDVGLAGLFQPNCPDGDGMSEIDRWVDETLMNNVLSQGFDTVNVNV